MLKSSVAYRFSGGREGNGCEVGIAEECLVADGLQAFGKVNAVEIAALEGGAVDGFQAGKKYVRCFLNYARKVSENNPYGRKMNPDKRWTRPRTLAKTGGND